MGAALSKVRPKPEANKPNHFFNMSLKKDSSPPGWPHAGWHLMVLEQGGWNKTSGGKYQYHFSIIVVGFGASLYNLFGSLPKLLLRFTVVMW